MTDNAPGSAEEQEAAELPTVAMRHQFNSFTKRIFFYEGQQQVVDGVAEVSVAFAHWAPKMHILGYRCDANGDLRDYADTMALFARLAAGEASPESAESAEEKTDESPDGGRQPAPADRVRSRAKSRAGSLPVEGVAGGDGSGAADVGDGAVTLSDLEGLSA